MNFRARLDAICASLPGAVWADPTEGELASWKIGGKMFACTGTMTPGVSVKCPDVETAEMLIEAGAAEKAKYFHRSWVRLGEDIDDATLRHRLETSYDVVRSGLTKKVQAALPARENG